MNMATCRYTESERRDHVQKVLHNFNELWLAAHTLLITGLIVFLVETIICASITEECSGVSLIFGSCLILLWAFLTISMLVWLYTWAIRNVYIEDLTDYYIECARTLHYKLTNGVSRSRIDV